MSKLPNGLFGNISGKLNNVIISSWKGIPYVKSKPTQIRDPKTPLQAAQRSRFSRIMSIMVPLSQVVRIGFKGYADKMSAFNAAVSYNLKQAFSADTSNPEIQYPNLLFSRGNHIGIEEGLCEAIPEGSVRLLWKDKPSLGGSYANDRIMAVLVNETSCSSAYYPDAGSRVQGSIILALPQYQPGDVVHSYIAMINPAKALSGNAKQGISDSRYVGCIAAL